MIYDLEIDIEHDPGHGPNKPEHVQGFRKTITSKPEHMFGCVWAETPKKPEPPPNNPKLSRTINLNMFGIVQAFY